MVKGKSLILGITIGGTLGFVATLFSAPSSGKNMRYRVKEQSTEWREMLDGMKFDGQHLKKQISETSKEGASMMKNLTLEMKHSIEEWRKTVEPHKKNIQEYIEQIETSLKDLEDKVKQKS